MLTTIQLTQNETNYYPRIRQAMRRLARGWAIYHGRRFAQIVGANGRILDVLEVTP